MKMHSLILLLAGCLLALSACQAQAAEPQPAATPGVAAADLEAMQRDLAEAREDMQRALEEVNVKEKIKMTSGAIATPNVRITGPGAIFMGGRRQPESVLLVPSKPIPAEEASQLCEDMRVMSMILNDAAGPNQTPDSRRYGRSTGMVIRPGFIGFGGQSSPETIWLDGYGVVFTLEVDFPLVALDEGEDMQPQTEQEKADEVWQRNRDRLKGVESPYESVEKPAVAFDPDRVQRLQKRLTEALRHASNIRNLTAKDKVVVIASSVLEGEHPHHLNHEYGSESDVAVPTSVMALQAVKQDIDAFAAEKLDLDEFAQKVAVVIY